MPFYNITTPSGQKVQVDAVSQFDAMGSLLGQTGPDVSQLGSFGRGALSMIPLGDQAYAGVASAAQNEPYTQERQELAQEQAQDKEVNPGSTYAGKAVGLAAPIIATGGLGAPEELAGALGQGAILGGAYGAGNAVDTLASGGSGAKAAGDVALGAGLGAAGAGVGEGLSNLVGRAGDAIADSKVGQRFNSINISKGLGLRPISLSTIARKEGSTPQAAAQGLWDDIKGIPGLPDNFTSMGSSINDKVAALEGLKDAAGDTIGVTRNLGGNATAGNFPEGDQAIKDLVSSAEGFKGIPDGSADNMKHIAAQIQAAKESNNLDFNTLSQIRTAVGSQVQSEVPGASQIYRILSNNLDSALDRVGDTAGIDKPAFQAAKKTYAVTSKVLPLMQRGAGREATGASGGLEKIAGGLGLATGHPAAAIPALAHGIQKLVAPEALDNLMLSGAGALPKAVAGSVPATAAIVAAKQAPETPAPTDIHLQHSALSPWRQVFAQNAAQAKDPGEVAKANAVTDFTLSQRDPAYAAAKAKAAENPETPGTPTDMPTNMAEGGIVAPNGDDSTLSQVEDAIKSKLEGFQGYPAFGSTLPGLETMARKAAGDTDEPVRTAAPDESFNPQLADMLKAYMLKKGDSNAQ